MRFQLTDAQRKLRNEARSFAQEVIKPQAIELDQAEAYPTEILDELADRGYAGLTISERYDGMGDGLVDLAIVIEELSAALMPVAGALALHLGVAEVIERFGTDEQRDRYLPSMASYDTVGVLGLSEAHAGSNKLEMATRAERDGNEWVLNGHKQWLTNFQHGDD